jgi:hypothetical protein
MPITWNAIPFGKFFERLLWIHLDIPLKRGTVKYPSRFKAHAKKFLETEVKKLPPCPMRTLMLKAIPNLPRPTELILQSHLLGATAKSTPKYQDIMSDPETVEIIELGGLLLLPDHLIWERLTNIELGLGQHIRFGDLEKYLYNFWNTSEKDGWSKEEEKVFHEFLKSDAELTTQYERLLKYGFGSNRLEVMREYGFPLTPEGRTRSYNLLADSILSTAILASQKGDTQETGISIQNLNRLTNIMKAHNIPYEVDKEDIRENTFQMIPRYKVNSG